MRTVSIFGGIVGLMLVVTTIVSVPSEENRGVVAIGSVRQPILTLRVRVMNDRQEPVRVITWEGGTQDSTVLGTVPPSSTDTFTIPGASERIHVALVTLDGTRIVSREFTVHPWTDVAFTVPTR